MIPKTIRINLRKETHAQACRTTQPWVRIYIRDGDTVYKASVGVYLSPDGRVYLEDYHGRKLLPLPLRPIHEPKPSKRRKCQTPK